MDRALGARFPSYVGFRQVWMPPIWKEREPVPFHFFVFRDDLSPTGLHAFLAESGRAALPNARPVSRGLLELASLFHPLFYASFTSRPAEGELARLLGEVRGCRLRRAPESAIHVASPPYYIQSLLFLAGCTLSAAVVQDGTS
jgi:hypothetical protein